MTEQRPPWAEHLEALPAEMRNDLLRLPAVLERTGYSQAGWYRAIQTGAAPAGRLRGSTTVWPAREIEAFCRWQADTLPLNVKREPGSRLQTRRLASPSPYG